MLSPRVRSKFISCFRSKTLGIRHVYVDAKENIFNYRSKYDKDQERIIFKILNDSSAEELSRITLSRYRLMKILKLKENNVRFESFSDLLNIDGFGVKIMEKMCDSMLSPHAIPSSASAAAPNKIKGKYIDPALDNHQKTKLESAISVNITLENIGWARIEREGYKLTHWKLYDINSDDGKKLQLSNIMEIVWSVCNTMPKSDVYIFEALPTVLRSSGADTNNPKTIHINLQKAQLVAMLSAALTTLNNQLSYETSDTDSDSTETNEDNKKDEKNALNLQHKVFYLRPTLPSRLFKTYVGKERVSAQSVIDNILNEAMDHTENRQITNIPILSKRIDVMTEIYKYYSSQTDVKKEYLCETLMLIITFMELCIYKNSNAFKILSR